MTFLPVDAQPVDWLVRGACPSALPGDLESIGRQRDDVPRAAARRAVPLLATRATAARWGEAAGGVPAAGRTGGGSVTAAYQQLHVGAVGTELHPPPAAGRRGGGVLAAGGAGPRRGFPRG